MLIGLIMVRLIFVSGIPESQQSLLSASVQATWAVDWTCQSRSVFVVFTAIDWVVGGVPEASLLGDFSCFGRFNLVPWKNAFCELDELILHISELSILHLIELFQFAALSDRWFTAPV